MWLDAFLMFFIYLQIHFFSAQKQLRYFLDKRFTAFAQLKLLLTGNPWTCTCEEKDFQTIQALYPEVENFDDLDSELRAYMVLNTYLKRDDPNFWNKLIYSMPHGTRKERREPAPEAIEVYVINPTI